MASQKLYLYTNQVHYRVGHSYVTPLKNFTDFMAAVARLDGNASLLLPCGVLDASTSASGEMLMIDLTGSEVVELPLQGTRYKAPFVNLLSAWNISRRVTRDLRAGISGVIAGPGPNSFMFWCSLLMPRETQFAFFIRGDTVRTVHNIYKGRLIYPFAMMLVKLFRHRIRHLLGEGRAQVFLFGDALSTQYPAAPGRSHVITPLIDRAWVRSTPRGDARRGRPEPFRVLFVGRISPEKNLGNLIEACYLAQQGGAAFALTIVGSGPHLAEMRDLVSERQLDDKVKFLGHVSHGPALAEIFDGHDLLCLPSYTEGTPRCIAEAVARRLPVVATQVGSIHTMFPGYIVPIKGFSPQDIEECISFTISNYLAICVSTDEAWAGVGRFVIDDIAHDVLCKLKRRTDMAEFSNALGRLCL